ncbi:MAG: glyoxalase/bleomycin resistance/extradiol dioxygenase family protein [Ginsengibacter sp.]
MTKINAYINFSGNCREAMTFYKESLEAELTMQTVGESPIAAQCPTGMQDQIMHAILSRGQVLAMGSDMVGPGGFIKGNDMALLVNCSSDEEINIFFSRLAEGGQILDPLKVQFWGATFGVLIDKFGTRWMFNYDKNQQQ